MFWSDHTFRWSKKEITNFNYQHSFYHIKDIKGVIYGKCTYALRKKYNADLEPW